MRLQKAIIDGKFCGLETVEECYINASRFMNQIFSYEQAPYEQFELDQEMSAYEADYGAIDWEVIDKELVRLDKEYQEWLDKHHDDIMEGWQSG